MTPTPTIFQLCKTIRSHLDRVESGHRLDRFDRQTLAAKCGLLVFHLANDPDYLASFYAHSEPHVESL